MAELTNDLSLRAILGVLRRQFYLVAVTFFLFAGGALTVALQTSPTYLSTTMVMVDPSYKNLLNPAEGSPGGSFADATRVDSEVELVRPDDILIAVIGDLGLIDDQEFGVSLGLRDRLIGFLRLGTPEIPTGEAAIGQILEKLRAAVTVRRVGLTYLISVQAKAIDPKRAAEIANSVAEHYIQAQLRSKIDSLLKSRDVLSAQLSLALDNMASTNNDLDTFLDSNIEGLAASSDNANLIQLQAQIAQLGQTREQASTIAARVQESVKGSLWGTAADLLASQAIRELNRQRDLIVGRLAEPSDFASTSGLRDQLRALDASLKQQTQLELTQLQNSIASTRDQENVLRQKVRDAVLDSSLPADVLAKIYGLQRKAQLAVTQYENLLARSEDLDTQASLQVADSRVASPALPALRPSSPNIPSWVFTGCALGLSLGVGLAFLRENFVGGFASEQHVQSTLQLRLVAALPRQKRTEHASLSLADLIVTQPLSVFAESVRRVRTMLDSTHFDTEAAGQTGSRVIAVMSAHPNEGKTTVALALARSFVLAGKSTLLIDADLRKPGLHEAMGLVPEEGLLEVLARGDLISALGSAIKTDGISNVTALLGKAPSQFPTDQLVSGEQFKKLIAAARNTFDVVVIDTPPLDPVVDGYYLSRYVDDIVFVVKWESTSQIMVRSILAKLSGYSSRPLNLLVALNQDGERVNFGKNKSYYS